MKNNIYFIALFFLFSVNSFAHFLWIETNTKGKINQKQEVKVFFGEYSYGAIDKVGEEGFEKVKNFTLWAISPNGDKIKLEVTPEATFYKTTFTPKVNGTYTIVLNNNEIDVIDYTQYDFGIFKTHYHATAKIEVGEKYAETVSINPEGITIVDVSKKNLKLNDEVVLKILYKNKPVKDNEVVVFLKNQFNQKIKTDENGLVKFTLPFATKYIVETTIKEEVSGKYNGKEYQFVFHSATYPIMIE
ncbi:DUF4198 domain-containing protein [Flavobacterium turcicum]|uniref:DUF4198 domain-containing protein n=1 Tax=Flavobacterium turcicum TaxID=2764718 RepID=A0ABR7JEC7_9FLAO|nr:DUF4198 domain-containing protein [Flavobacterium turcicum]MBC5862861.1 DUF4198 domain-containing protein [Flavobacterium turcicum]NHL01593.1 DUF4198 domain-containing protein [Flavobacterium turcicum]